MATAAAIASNLLRLFKGRMMASLVSSFPPLCCCMRFLKPWKSFLASIEMDGKAVLLAFQLASNCCWSKAFSSVVPAHLFKSACSAEVISFLSFFINECYVIVLNHALYFLKDKKSYYSAKGERQREVNS